MEFVKLSALGREFAPEHGKHLRDGVRELRAVYQHHQHRIPYMFREDILPVTNAFLKKSAKVPEDEIEKALRAMFDRTERRCWETI